MMKASFIHAVVAGRGKKKLQAGDAQYRAFVGLPDEYDLLGLMQCALLYALGLREQHHLLDIGCGSLRAGRLLIPYLKRNRYCGVEPHRRVLLAGLWNELGFCTWLRKNPAFLCTSSFVFTRFRRQFDFILAQSIASHCTCDMALDLLVGAKQVLAPAGIFALTFITEEQSPDMPLDPAGRGWVYPGCVRYRPATIDKLFRCAGLAYKKLPWYHPRQSWYLAAHAAETLDRFSPACMAGYCDAYTDRGG